jgi:2-amino-4-hydroxy-6-hydroxymethyldihydropteridine diphosphokinase
MYKNHCCLSVKLSYICKVQVKKTIFVALGSNIDPRFDYLAQARQQLQTFATGDWAVSPIYQTAPVGPSGQADYLNQVLTFSAVIGAPELLSQFKKIEQRLGRQDRGRWAAREIDVDLLYCGAEQLDSPELSVPHLRIAERSFVLEPLCDLAPDWYDVRQQQTVAQLLTALKSSPNYTACQLWSP